MSVSVGDRVPDLTLHRMTADGPAEVQAGEFFAGRKVAVFAVPGAFTPTCHAQHVPSFLNNLDALKGKGVDEVACLAVNDVFVLKQWAEATGADGKITFLADGAGNFAKAMGLDIDLSGHGLGVRSRRYAALVDDGVIKALNVEEVPSSAEKSSAEELLKSL